ncbi:MAG: His/Gly/Thr/Pro-type tRNA ligase C-terminal domain-containing protein, partial [Candidatus Woesearchaeota archaeon]
ETERYIHLYAKLCEELLAMPVIVGKKTDAERFAGAVHTYTIEAFLPDGKALQAGTSHHLGQGFAKAFGISYTGKDKQQHIPWQNSWGISTRLIGGLVMTHADDKGMVLPPSVTEQKIVIIPVYTKEDKEVVDTHVQQLAQQLPNVIVDDSEEYSFGHKCKEWELKGIPLRVEIGPKDIAQQQVILVRRDTHEKITCPLSQVAQQTATLLKTIQQDLYTQAKQRMEALIVEVTSKEAFMKNAPNNMFICAPFCGEASVEEAIKQETGLGSRCFDMHKHITHEKCFYSGKPAIGWCYFSRSY